MAREIKIVTRERKSPDLELIASALLDLVLDRDDETAESDLKRRAA